jgi:hypothetical protein
MANLVCSSYEVIAVTTGIKGLTAAKVTPTTGRFAGQMAKQVILTLESYDMRYSCYSGTTVSSSVGTPMEAGQTIVMDDKSFRDLTFIRSEGTNAALHVSYFHEV